MKHTAVINGVIGTGLAVAVAIAEPVYERTRDYCDRTAVICYDGPVSPALRHVADNEPEHNDYLFAPPARNAQSLSVTLSINLGLAATASVL